jgi:NADPH:quinone reductase-like Zn-dependent oxidoreductase
MTGSSASLPPTPSDRVITGFDVNDQDFHGDLANAPASLVARHPSSLSWVEAAAIWMQYMTAYGALIDIAGLKSSETVAIAAASSRSSRRTDTWSQTNNSAKSW